MDLLLGVRGRLVLRGVSEGVCAGAVRGRRRGRGGHGEYPGRLLLLLLRLAPGSRSQVRRVLIEVGSQHHFGGGNFLRSRVDNLVLGRFASRAACGTHHARRAALSTQHCPFLCFRGFHALTVSPFSSQQHAK